MELSFDQIFLYWQTRHPDQRIAAREKAAVKCVLHGEKTPSCTLFLDGNGGFYCHGCGAKGNLFQFEMRFSGCDAAEAEINVAAITGATPRPRRESGESLGPPVAIYDYRNENGSLLFQKRRYEPEVGGKTFRIFHQKEGKWVSGIDPTGEEKNRRVVFNLPTVVTANLCFITEGEKDAESLLNANLFPNAGYNIAYTTSYDGAWKPGQTPKWLDIYNPYFTGKMVFIFPDNDDAGRAYAECVAAGIKKYAYDVRIVTLPDMEEKGDVSDYLKTHTTEELETCIKESKTWTGDKIERANYFVEAVQWASTADEQIEWLVDGIIQKDGNGMIAAEPKTGKSLCTLDLLLSLACGIPWLGHKVPRRIRCAYISREDSPILTKARLKMLLRGKGGTDPEESLWINTREQLGNFDVDDEEQLVNMANDLKVRGIEFAVFDVLNRLHSREENNNTEMAQVVQKISRIGLEAGCSIGVVHHVSKETGGGRFFTRIRGASSLHGWTEWSIGLSLVNPSDNTSTPIRCAEFETKAGEAAPPVEFILKHGDGTLSLAPVTTVKPGNPADVKYRFN